MAEVYSEEGYLSSSSWARKFRCYLNAYTEEIDDNTYRVHYYALSEMIAAYQYGMRTYVFIDGTQVGSSEGVLQTNPGQTWTEVCRVGWGTKDFSRTGSDYSVTVVGRASAEEVNGYGGDHGHKDASITLTIPARPYRAHGNPTIKTSDSGVLQDGTATISWEKSSTQGNANFDHFELWQQKSKEYNSETDKKLYPSSGTSGSGTSYTVTPSDFAGANGGDVFYVVYEYHEWYGSHPYTSAAVVVHVMPTIVKPTVTVAKGIVNYSEKVKISWSTSNTAGTLSKYQLYQGANTILYEGTETSCDVIPSETSGPQGGIVTYTLVENRTWYDKSISTSSTFQVKVRSGVCTVYDSSGNKHTALVTAYDSKGVGHYVLITAYDSSGKAHNVV